MKINHICWSLLVAFVLLAFVQAAADWGKKKLDDSVLE